MRRNASPADGGFDRLTGGERRPYTGLHGRSDAVITGLMPRETCYRCFWPKSLCWCGSITPMATRTRFVFLMHPKEYKYEKAGTGRLTHLCLAHSEVHVGIGFDTCAPVQALLDDPENYPVLLYPGEQAHNLSTGGLAAADLGGRRLVILLLDATWSGARKMLRLSPSLQRLPRVMFTPTHVSRYVIKQQPQDGCLSTLEAVHETLLALARCGLDDYPLPAQLLGLFERMQTFQIRCALDPTRAGYRRRPYSEPGQRTAPHGRSGARRSRYLRAPDVTY
ncbi:tRNA-uridine aminocarboxypropyltransferase [Opitutus terrae]|nr:tRNA-uridine aminocarboxypropyltransferase [Opitutus terrae]